jgi:hypothetical protein
MAGSLFCKDFGTGTHQTAYLRKLGFIYQNIIWKTKNLKSSKNLDFKMALSFAKILAPARINCPSTKWDRKMNDSSMTD